MAASTDLRSRLAFFRDLQLRDTSDLSGALENPILLPSIDRIQNLYFTGFPQEVVRDLADFFQVTNEGCKKFEFRVEVLDFLVAYHNLIKDFYVGTYTSINACLRSLSTCQEAIRIAESERMEASLDKIDRCVVLANKIKDVVGGLIAQVEKLIDLSRKSLIVLCEEDTRLTMESKIAGVKSEMTDLIEIAIKVLGKGKITFQNIRLYFRSFDTYCKDLTHVSHLQDWAYAELREELVLDILTFAFKWFALAKINLIACRSMRSVDKYMDITMVLIKKLLDQSLI